MNPLLLNAYRWFLMLGGILLLVSGVFGLVFSRGWRGLLLPAGSVAVLMLGGAFAGLWTMSADDVRKLLSIISLCLIGLVIATFVGTALALMFKKLSE